jgi:vancomycin resistance protein VanW
MAIPGPSLLRRALPFSWRVAYHRWQRHRQWKAHPQPWAATRGDPATFPHVLSERSSPYIREGAGTKPEDAAAKKHNLSLACAGMDGLVIQPGEVFSFCRIVGPTTLARGFLPGLEMHDRQMTRSPGGGLCQLANLLFGLAIDTDAAILERHRHSFDLYPDTDRTVPFGFGATVFYNHVDFQFRNRLDQPMLLEFDLGATRLTGRLRGLHPTGWTILVVETNHRFFRQDGKIWRENRLWREKENSNGTRHSREFLLANKALVLYPADHLVEEET